MTRLRRARYKTTKKSIIPGYGMGGTTPKSGQKVELHFYSVEEVLEYLTKAESMFPKGCHSHIYEEGSFCSFSWTDSMTMLRAGWAKGVKEIDLKVSAIERHVADERPEYQHELQGDFLDIGHYLSGQPDCFMAAKPVECERPEVDIIVNTSYSSGISQETIINRGAAITAFVDALQRNYFVNLTFVQKVTGYMGVLNNMDVAVYFHVDMKNTYSRDLIAFIAANPAYLRRIVFGIEEIALNYNHLGSYGTPADIEPPKDVVYFPCLLSSSDYKYRFTSMESTIREVERLIAETEAKHAKAC
jgi:hypothetical protein